MKACCLLMVLFVCACCCGGQRSAAKKQAVAARDTAEKDAVAYVKAIDVKTLDPSLPSHGLEDWLKSGPPHTDFLMWRLDETCDLMGDSSDADYPRCVRIEFRRGGQEGYFLILIGTLHKGIIGPPQLYEGIGVFEEAFVNTGWTDRLSGLPNILDQPLISTPVTDLYEQVVARHPIGIPAGSDKTALWPFLSRRLIQHLETARACQDDYARQHPEGGADAKPAWIHSGIFVGDGKRSAPRFINTGGKELQKDGSYRVSMTAVERNDPGTDDSIVVGGGIRAYRVTPDGQWLIVATVVPENGRFFVDDVRIFDGPDSDSPSHLLSESFAGCDGTRWTGEHVDTKPPAALPLPHYTDWDAVNVLRGAAWNEEVAFAKALDVHQLDSSLPSQSLEDWLKSGSLRVHHIEWHASRCNIKEGRYGATRDPEGRLCAGVWFQRGNPRVDINVSKDSSGPPKLEYLGVADKDDGLLAPVRGDSHKVSDSDRLSDLPRLLDEEAVMDVTRNLYDAVVARHPLGIPLGQDKVKFGPLLSKRLRGQLETAQACRVDYVRQHPRSAKTPEPAWFNAGLFSGDGALALPGADLVDHKTRQEDGSFLVWVWLSREDSAVPGSVPPASRWRNWHVSAVVKSEGGRFVVDDVRLFGGNSMDGPSRLLSDLFPGCDGPRWVGIGSTTR